MTKKPHKLAHFFREVWRRRVLQVALPYCVGGWLLIEVSDVVLGAFEAPNWILQSILIVFLAALPIVVGLAWVFDITPAGLVRTSAAGEEEETEAAPAPAMGLSLGDSERRQVTMLHCSFDFHTGQDTSEDPEFLHDAVLALEGLFKDIATRYSGHRQPGSAEELTLLFGYPNARDDDARRAVAAGLALLEGARRLDENHDGIPDLAAHIAIHTGLVVIDESHKDGGGITVIGQLPRYLSWLQGIGPEDVITISNQTRELVQRHYICESLGEFRQAMAGGQVEVFQVHAGPAPIAANSKVLPVGRELELAQLQARWQHAADGDGQFVLVKGEPGIGKSSLLQAFQQGVQGNNEAWVLQVYCSPYEQNTALYPIVQAIRVLVLGLDPIDSKKEKWDKLQSFVERRAAGFENALPLLANLLSLTLPEDMPALSGSPQHVRTQTLELLIHIIRQQSKNRPMLLVIEDLLWADPTTLEWIRMMVEEGPSPGTFLLLTARPSFAADWTRRSYVLVLELLPLARKAAAALLKQTAGDIDLPPALVEYIIRETGGNPLYVHELTRAVLESDQWQNVAADARAEDLGWMKIPATLQDSLAARIDHLGAAKALLQLCSVMGREFDYQQLYAVSGSENEEALKQDLNTIVQAELLFRRGSSSNPSYTFKHILIQETAYNSLLKSKRKELHLRAATILEQEYPDVVQQEPALLAWHYGEGGELEKAIGMWTLAARSSLQGFANHEAITQANHGLKIIHSLKNPAQSIAQEIPLRVMLGSGLLATRGYAAPEVREAFSRAQDLCESVGDSPQLFQVVVGLWMFYLISANHEQALELSRTLVRIADTSEEPGKLLQSRYCLGYTLFYRGEYQDACQHLEMALSYEQEGVDYTAQSASGDDTRSHVRVVLAHLSWHLGKPQTALQYINDALKLAKKEANPFGIAFVTFSAAWFHVSRHDAKTALPLARSAYEMAEKNGYGFFQPTAHFMLTWAEGRSGSFELAARDRRVADDLKDCVKQARANGSRVGQSFLSLTIAQDLISLAEYTDAEELLETTWAEIDQYGERYFAAEYFRLRGIICLRHRTDADGARQLLEEGCKRANSSGSLALALRCSSDLAEALDAMEQSQQAVAILTEALESITEKDSSLDNKRARQILKRLGKQKK